MPWDRGACYSSRARKGGRDLELHLTAEQLRQRGGVLDELLNVLFYSAVIIDDQARILFINRNGGSYTGYTQEEAVGVYLYDHTESDDWRRALRGETVLGAVANIARKKCVSNFYPVRDGERVVGALGVIPYKGFREMKEAISAYAALELGTPTQVYTQLSRIRGNYTLDDFVGESGKVRRLKEQCLRAARTRHPILLIGETGCGKEILASAIHEVYRGEEVTPFIKINCTAIPNELLESEFFGHEKGAFTGANTLKHGKFELAENGPILLDEIGDMDLRLQGKLLRVLEEKEFERVGGARLLPLKARVVASTNRDLWQLCREGKFRTDLYYRLNLIEIRVPALRERREDVYLLVEHFRKAQEEVVTFTDEAYDFFFHYDGPGNVRELRNLIIRLSILCPGRPVGVPLIREMLHLEAAPSAPPVEDEEKGRILEAVRRSGGNLTAAARALGIGRTTLYARLKRLGLEHLCRSRRGSGGE